MIPTQKTLSMKRKYRIFPEREDVIPLSFEHRNGAWPQKNSACLGIGAGASTSQKNRSVTEDFSQMARHMPCLPNLPFEKIFSICETKCPCVQYYPYREIFLY